VAVHDNKNKQELPTHAIYEHSQLPGTAFRRDGSGDSCQQKKPKQHNLLSLCFSHNLL